MLFIGESEVKHYLWAAIEMRFEIERQLVAARMLDAEGIAHGYAKKRWPPKSYVFHRACSGQEESRNAFGACAVHQVGNRFK